jgi:thioester reductase-like protein
MDSIFNFLFLTGFTGLMGFFRGEKLLGRRPFYPDDPVNPV